MAKTKIPMMVRVERDLQRILKRAAKANGRSLNAEIVQRLMDTLARHDLIADIRFAIREELNAPR
jgi:predicted HicB family RNase H-like nuclease